MTLAWKFIDWEPWGEIARWGTKDGLHAEAVDMDGDASVWMVEIGDTLIWKGERWEGNHFEAARQDAEAFIRDLRTKPWLTPLRETAPAGKMGTIRGSIAASTSSTPCPSPPR